MIPSAHPILVVDDDPNDQILIKRAFRGAKVANMILTASDGDEAVRYLSGEGAFDDRTKFPLPSLVLLDLKLPRRTGLEVLEWIRQQAGLKRMVVVILTSSKASLDINRAYDLGANSYLVKPVSFESLVALIKSLDMYWLLLNEKPEVHDGD
jgi:CheY-like chemotaxis protein